MSLPPPLSGETESLNVETKDRENELGYGDWGDEYKILPQFTVPESSAYIVYSPITSSVCCSDIGRPEDGVEVRRFYDPPQSER